MELIDKMKHPFVFDSIVAKMPYKTIVCTVCAFNSCFYFLLLMVHPTHHQSTAEVELVYINF